MPVSSQFSLPFTDILFPKGLQFNLVELKWLAEFARTVNDKARVWRHSKVLELRSRGR